MHGTRYQHRFADEEGPEYRFGVVRHPLDRLLSCFSFFCLSDRLKNHPGMREIGYRPGMSWVEFLSIALQRHNDNEHTRFQAVFMGPHRFDRLARLENLGAAWAELRERFPVIERDVAVSHQSSHGDWRDAYDAGLRRWAELVFAADLDLYERAT